MSTVFESKPQAPQNLADISSKLEFQKQLQAVTNKIHATSNVDEIMLELGQDICSLIGADRLTIYTLSEDRNSIVSKVKTGLTSFKDLKLPINDQSIAGYVALNRTLINIRDVYDENELRSLSPGLRFLKEVDKRTGYRTKQMLVAPVVDATAGELIGVVQAINTRSGQPFQPLAEEGVVNLCETLAIAFKQRQKTSAVVRGRYDALVANAVLSAEEMELAVRSARRKGLDIEAVLLDEFQVKPAAIGEALSAFFGVPYEPFRMDRIKPLDLLKNLKRDFLESSLWVPVEDAKDGSAGGHHRSRAGARLAHRVQHLPEEPSDLPRVHGSREFTATLDQFFGGELADTSSIGDLLSGMDEDSDEEGGSAGGRCLAGRGQRTGQAGQQDHRRRLQPRRLRHPHRALPRQGQDRDPLPQGRHAGALHLGAGQLPQRDRRALEDHVRPGYLREAQAAGRQDQVQEVRPAGHRTAGGHDSVGRAVSRTSSCVSWRQESRSRWTSWVCPRATCSTLKETVSKPYGLFFVCGPTGSGKTTTLHSVLGYLNTPDTKIWTAEDPVEITQKGLRQVQMNPKAGLELRHRHEGLPARRSGHHHGG